MTHRDGEGVRHPELLERAIRVAVQQHDGQTRKGDQQPFITHPVAVALLCARAGLDVETVAAALLHDVIEDTEVSADELAGLVGSEVARIVEEVTKEEGNLTAAAKTRRYLEGLRTASLRALAVAAADKIHNLAAIVSAVEHEGRSVERRFNSSFAERVRAYQDVRELIHTRWPDCPLLPELDRQLTRARETLL